MKPIEIRIDKLYKDMHEAEDLQVAVPFAKGVLKDEQLKQLRIMDGDKTLPCLQMKVTGRWNDSSIKFLFIRFQADVEGNAEKSMWLQLADEASQSYRDDSYFEGSAVSVMADESVDGIRFEYQEGEYLVDNGPLSFGVADGSEYLFTKFKYMGRDIEAERFCGPVVRIMGENGFFIPEKWEVAEEGPLCVILECTGHTQERIRMVVRMTVNYGKSWLDVGLRLFNDSEDMLRPESWSFSVKRKAESRVDLKYLEGMVSNKVIKIDSTGCGDGDKSECGEDEIIHVTGTGELASIEEKLSKTGKDAVRTMTGTSNYKTRFSISGKAAPLTEQVFGDMLVKEANEHFGEVFYGTFFADVTDEEGGVCLTVFQAQQNYPKAVKAEEAGVTAYLIPDGKQSVMMAGGMAREQRILVHFHEKDVPMEALDDRSIIYQMPIQAYVTPEAFGDAGVFPGVVTPLEKADPDVELEFIARADGHGRAYGMMNWGDFPDANYTAQGRGHGRQVWTNNEYDYPHAMFLMYARSGVRRFLDYAKVAAQHWMDVDVCHYSTNPLHIGGQWEHTAGHNGGEDEGIMVCSHEWVEGLLDLWHFTGDDRALETALGIGENVLRLLETPMYQKPGEASARETGWALRSLTALYIETHEEKWLKRSQDIIQQFAQWRERYGAWLAPYTDNTVIRVGFMISIAVGSLMRYYRQFPSEELKEMMLYAIDDITDHFRNPFGLFYYKELPSLSRNGTNTLLLEAMTIGYELTGDKKYLEYGLRTFHRAMEPSNGYNGNKRMVEDAVLVGNTSPKGFAQSFLPLVSFYNALIKEKLI